MTLVSTRPVAASSANASRPFHISVPQEEFVDLHQRIAAARWPDRETVTGRSQSVQLETMQELARDWATGYE